MKSLVSLVLIALFIPSLAGARRMDRTVTSGQASIVGRYYTWTDDCSSAFGTVKVVIKPQHGTIANQLVDTRIGISRRKRAADHCLGKPIKALAVTYKSEPGFHGYDHFSVDATFHAYREVDTFTVHVE